MTAVLIPWCRRAAVLALAAALGIAAAQPRVRNGDYIVAIDGKRELDLEPILRADIVGSRVDRREDGAPTSLVVQVRLFQREREVVDLLG